MIVTVGESLVDIIGGKAFPGGSPLNVAAASSRLDSSAAYVGRISSDSYGKQILDMLIDDIVFFEPRLCNAAERTSSAMAVANEKGDVSYTFDFDGTASVNVTASQIRSGFESIADLQFLFAGSVSLALEPCGTSIEEVVLGLDEDVVVMLDPNVRTSVSSDMSSLRARIERLAARASVVRFSSDDIAALYPGFSDEQTAGRMSELGVKNTIITRGSKGSSWYSDGMVFFEPAIAVKPVDTVGCGDTFDGAVLHCLDRIGFCRRDELSDENIRRILRFATVAATENCLKSGCNPPHLCDSEELEKIDSLWN
ncbi:MAG: PfkB family carbohydrate kinase [Sphaerochaetaceae bacterium]